ncbi:MAG: MFS transporter [bacterium]|nr:MFS transporter [bacterium]
MSSSQQEKAGIVDVKQLGLIASILSLGYVFWIVGAMEMIERLAYYGVRAVAGLYAKSPLSEGGLGVTPAQFGTILMVWSGFQGFIPIFVGGLADRYGYKLMIGISTAVKMTAYLIMAALPSFYGFMLGAICLATGTAIFKPGIQGTLAKATNRQNSSMAWGIFYQTVNIGGFIGPLLAGFMRKMEWQYVFIACACIISINFLLLLTYKEPGKEERLEHLRQLKESGAKQKSLARETLQELGRPELIIFLSIFTGFYFMFNSLFDVLPLHLDDWVDSRDVVSGLSQHVNMNNPVISFVCILDKSGTGIQPEGMLNLNCGMIMVTCFFFAWLSSKMKILRSIALGTSLAALALCGIGMSNMGWMALAAIAVFSVGEMLSSPKFSEFVGSHLAPSDKKAMYLGLGQMSFAIGSTIEGKLGPWLYDHMASKERFSREMLNSYMNSADISSIPQGEAFTKLVELSGQKAEVLTHMMYTQHNVASMWYIMAGVGFLTAFLILCYGAWLGRRNAAAAKNAASQGCAKPEADGAAKAEVTANAGGTEGTENAEADVSEAPADSAKETEVDSSSQDASDSKGDA